MSEPHTGPPPPPPNRTINSLFGETRESKQRRAEWDALMAKRNQKGKREGSLEMSGADFERIARDIAVEEGAGSSVMCVYVDEMKAILVELEHTRDSSSDGVRMIAAERRRQVEREGWTPEHDDTHIKGQMAIAAACYALGEDQLFFNGQLFDLPLRWPWHPVWWKPKDRISDLTRAGALIAAEIDRLKRREAAERAKGGA